MRAAVRLLAAVLASLAIVACTALALMAFAPAAAALHAPSAQARPKAPTGPPLLGPYAGVPAMPADESSASAPPSQGDVLASNGLDSPSCREPAELAPAARRSCQTARFVAGGYPTGNYAFDVNIDTGVAKWSNDASAVMQNFAQFGWMWLVTATHGLIVMFEWCYSLNLLGQRLTGEVAGQLRSMGLGFTGPWLAPALSIAAALAAYHGLLRRRVAQTLGQAIATLAMMAAGLWVMLNPAGTVGTVQQWADEAGIGVLSIVAGGTPEHPRRTLIAGLGDLFGAVVSAPWCYLEFGDVRWCEEPRLLDARLHAAGLRIARRLQSESACHASCTGAAGAAEEARAASVNLLRGAHTNGELFLALPANKVQRNSVKTGGTLLGVLCGGGGSADSCRGPTAAQAEFRSENGTYGRVIGLLLIWMGALGMLLLFGFLAVRLLLSGVATLAYLLLAPAAVLLPVLGEGGRSAFRGWAVRLLEAAVSKLTYSFLFGVTLALTAMLLRLTALGWWAQWLLVCAFWWTAFLARHRALGLLWGESAGHAVGRVARRHSTGRRMEEAMQSSAALMYVTQTAGRALSRPGAKVEPPRPHPPAAPERRQDPAEAQDQTIARLRAEAQEREREQARLREEASMRAQRLKERSRSPGVEDLRAWAAELEASRIRQGIRQRRHKQKSTRLLKALEKQSRRAETAGKRRVRKQGPIILGQGED